MKGKNKEKLLTKKVLLSIVAAGMMGSFALNAEAADTKPIFDQPDTIMKDNVNYEEVTVQGAAQVTLNGGTVTGFKEERSDPDDSSNNGQTHADVAVIVKDAHTKLTAKNVHFIGEVNAVNGSAISITGGSVTAGNAYHDDTVIDKLSTEIGAHDDSTITLDNVDIQSNLGVFDGGTITVTNSNVNAADAIYAEGLTDKGGISAITLTSSNGNLTVGKYGIEAAGRAQINITGYTVNTDFLVADGDNGKNAVITLNGTEENTYTINKGIAAANGGIIQINGGTLKDNDLRNKMYNVKVPDDDNTYNTDAHHIILDQNGSISTMSNQIYANAASATQKESGEITNTGISFKGGSLILNDAQYTQAYTNSAQAELKKQGGTKLAMTGKLVDGTGDVIKDITVEDASKKFGSDTELDKVTAKADHNLLVGSNNTTLADKTIEGIQVKQQVENGFAVGKLDLGAGSDGLIITNDKEVTLGGSEGGSIITVGGADKDVKVIVGTNQAGAAKSNGNLNIGNSLATDTTSYTLNGSVVLNADSNLNINGQTNITKGLTLNNAMVNVGKGALKTMNLSVTGHSNVFGDVNAETLDAAAGSTLAIGDKEDAGRVTVDKASLNGGMLFLDPAWKDNATINDASGFAVKNTANLDGDYVIGQNSLLSLGADLTTAKNVFAKTRENWGKNDITAAAYIASSVDAANGSLTVNGALTNPPTDSVHKGTVTLADHSLLMVNGTKTASEAAITGVTSASVADSAKLYIDNAKKDTTYKIIDGSKEGWKADNIISNNKLLKFNVKDTGKDTYDVTSYSNSVKDAYGNTLLTGNVYDAALIADGAAADFVNNASNDHYNATDVAKISALNSASAMSELAGVEHGTYAASNLFTDAVAEHMSLVSKKDHDSDIWAKYVHSKENIDGLDIAGTGSKYDATYNGVVVGADLHKTGKAVIGAAFSYVDGSIEGNTLSARTENDADYYGVSMYGGIQNDDSAVIGDISYLHGKNDITQYNSGTTLTGSAKSDAFSIGVRAEKSVKAGAGKFVPYAGIRYMHLSTGNYTNSLGMSYDADDMNLWLLPVGVKYSADIKNGSWTIRPIAEVGYVWNMGDRNAAQTVSLGGVGDRFDYDVTDKGYYMGRFAVEAEKDNMTYGIGYEYQKGDSVKANKWMANINWKF